VKKSPDIFLEAARWLGLEPFSCLVIEDAVSGVTAARAAGSRCLGITNSFEADRLLVAGANWTAGNLASASDDVLEW
jgi:beta-phosphoglucomutase-like phosphatase (HAD superfamily)